MVQTIPRPRLLAALRDRLLASPAVTILGARQVGKTTIARELMDAWPRPSEHFDLEKPRDRQALSLAPERVLSSCRGLVVLDEVQRMPQVFEILRPLCDDPNRKAVFALLGSASPDLVKGVSETLAGRVRFVGMGGFSLLEVGSQGADRLWLRGGFPRAFLADSAADWVDWMDSFTRTFVERDIPGIRPGVSTEAVGRCWRMMAHLHGQRWNAAEVARSLDVRAPTANRYRDLLIGTYMVRLLPAWSENIAKRVMKSPKVYLRDSGMLHYQLGLESMRDVAGHPRYAASWEGFALEQVLLAHGDRASYYYATKRGAELDLLLRRHGRHWGFEFKASEIPRVTKSMHTVLRDLALEHLWVVYPGPTEYPMHDRITALPLARVHELDLNPRPARRLTSHRPSHSKSAGVLKYVLYMDGPSDLALLRALAERLGHPAADVWDDQANAFYLRDLRRIPGAAQADPGAGSGRDPRSGRSRFALTPAQHFRALRRDDPNLGGLAILDMGTELRQEVEEDGLLTIRWCRGEVERHLLRSEVLGIYAATRYFNRPVIDRIEDELLDVTYSVHPDGGRFLDDPERVERSPSEFVREFFRRLADRIGDESLLPLGDLHRLVRSMDKRDIPSEVSRVLDLLDTLFRCARRDQKCPVTGEPAAIRRESDRDVFVVMADGAEGLYRITGQALALIKEGGPDAGTRDRIVEALRQQWDAGVDRPVVDSQLVDSLTPQTAPDTPDS